jgi:hypothetical protein
VPCTHEIPLHQLLAVGIFLRPHTTSGKGRNVYITDGIVLYKNLLAPEIRFIKIKKLKKPVVQPLKDAGNKPYDYEEISAEIESRIDLMKVVAQVSSMLTSLRPPRGFCYVSRQF